ncbi:MAG TPA: PAS domain S-box protein, partial [Methanoregulaceae archaeon]|nr:PAS domain S-box protein [Methanoregulaceae archaeon]
QRKELFPPDLLVEQDATFGKVFDTGEPVRNETRIRFGEQEQWIDTNLVPLKDTAGQVTAVLGVARDITERKRVEITLALEKQRMESLLSISQTGRKSDTGIIAEVVEDSIRLTGSTIGYLATMNEDESVMTMQYWSKSAHESCRVIDKPIIYPIEKTGLWGEAVRQRKPVVTNDYAADNPFKRGTPPGHVRLVRHMNIPVFDGDRIVAIAGVGNKEVNYDEGDIRQLQLLTQGWWQLVIRKRAEIALRESEEKYRAFFTTTRDCIFITTIDGRWVDFNDAAVELFGYESRDDLMKITISSVYANPHERDSHIRYIRQNGYSFEYPVDLRKKDGMIINALISTVARKDASGTIIGFQGSIRDITERKRMENALRESEARLNSIIHGSPMLQFVIDKNHRVISWNKAIEEFSGIKEAEVLGTRDPWKAFYDTQRPVLSDMLIDEKVEQLPEWYKGKIIASRLVDGAYEGIDFFPKRGVSGTWLFFTAAPIRNADGEIIGAVETLEDITERKQAEEALAESRQLFSDIISFLPDPTFVIDRDGKVLAWNRALEQLSGISAGDIIGKGDHAYSLWQYGKGRPVLIDLVLNRDLDAARLNYTDIHRDGSTITAQTEITRAATGKKIPLSLVASPLIDSLGNTTGAIESMRDVSRLKEAEAELARINKDLEQIVCERTRALQEEIAQRMQAEKDVQAALDYTRSVIEANPDLMVVLDEAGMILDVNAAGPSLTGVSKEQLIGTPYFSYLIDDGTLRSAFAGLLDTGTLEKFVRIQRTDGHVTPLSVHATVVPGWKGKKKRIIVSGHDITRQKQDEEAIRASLDEKVILLREVHHRVKNNLQIIISLVNLQMRQTGDPTVKKIMAETQNRVRAMSLVHEKLYRSESLSRIDFADYTRYLATQLFSFYGTDTRHVRLEMTMGKTMVDINTAVPLGLLMNELISNALKHAFPQGREGTIRIGGGEEANLITLVIQDDGVGIPADIDWKNTTSLGMRLVTSLIDQVDGTITLDRESGTTFTITIKKDPAIGGAG